MIKEKEEMGLGGVLYPVSVRAAYPEDYQHPLCLSKKLSELTELRPLPQNSF